jgi:hypothetical protein
MKALATVFRNVFLASLLLAAILFSLNTLPANSNEPVKTELSEKTGNENRFLASFIPRKDKLKTPPWYEKWDWPW